MESSIITRVVIRHDFETGFNEIKITNKSGDGTYESKVFCETYYEVSVFDHEVLLTLR